MSTKLEKWPSKVKFSRGDKDGPTEYSTGGPKGEDVEVPQIDESLSLNDFVEHLAQMVGDAEETKKIINKNVLALPAIREGQTKYRQSHKKSGVMDNNDATKLALETIRTYTPTLAKERGAVVSEAFAKANKMDALTAARAKVKSGEITQEEYFQMLEEAFDTEE